MTRILLSAALLAVASLAFAQDEAVAEEDVGVLLQRARAERESLEEQIAREEERLARIEAELVQLRRQRALMASAQSAFELGEELYSSGSVVWARDAFRSVVDNFPESSYYPNALFRLELIAFQLQDFEGTLEYADMLGQASPGFQHMDLAQIVAGLAHHNLGDFGRARQRLAQVSPDSEYGNLADYLRAVGFVEEGDIASAKSVFSEIIDNAGRSRAEQALADRSRIALAQLMVEEEGVYEEALSLYDRISPFSSYYDVAMLGKVWTLMRMERYQDAYNLCERVIEEVPGSDLRSEFELAMANCALGAEDLQIAITKYENLLQENLESDDYYEMLLGEGSASEEKYDAERERLERIRVGLSELKEEAYTQGDLELVELIEEEEEALRDLFVEISGLESELALPGADEESLQRQLRRLISRSRESTEALAVSVEEVRELASNRGTEQDRQDLQQLETEIDRIRLSLQDLSSKFQSGMAQDHDWVQETNYGIAIARFMERELKRDSLAYLSNVYDRRIEEAYEEGDTTRAQTLISERTSRAQALNQRINQAAHQSAGYFEEYLANFPDSRFVPDVLVRLAQLYYDIDKSEYLDRMAETQEFLPEDYSRSIELYDRVLTNYPGSDVEDVALYSMGYCLTQMGNPTEGVSKYRTLLEDHPESELGAETCMRVGHYYFESFEYDSAYAYFSRILDYPDADPDVYQRSVYELGWTEYMRSNYLHSAAIFGYLIQDSQLMDSLGIARRGGAMVDEAMEYLAHDFMEQKEGPPVALASDFLDNFQDDDVSFTVLHHMARFYSEQGYWTDAISSYEALLARHPDNEQAPFFQAEIASAYEGLGDQAAATEAREELVEKYGTGSEWAEAVGGEAATAAVDSLRGQSLQQAIGFYYTKAQETADESPEQSRSYYNQLIPRVESYLSEFGNTREAYDFKFLLGDAYYALGRYVQAGDTYMDVGADSISAQRRQDAANNAWSAYMIAYNEQSGVDSAQLRSKQVEAANFYVDNFPDGENAARFLFGVAGNLYNAKDYAGSRQMYERIYNEYSNSEYVARSARFIAATYEAEEMYSEAEDWYGRASQAVARTGEDLGEDFDQLAAAAAYRDAETLAESEDTSALIAAAQRFEESARQHPGSQIAPSALYDAGETYARAGAIEDAIRVFGQLADEYPQSELAPQGMLRAAFLAREAERFELAGDTYLSAYTQFPSAPDMGSALYSAAISYEDAERMDLAVNVYDMIISEQTAGAEAMVHVLGKYSRYLHEQGQITRAQELYQSCIETYDQYRTGDVYYPAQSAFYMGEIAYEDYAAQETNPETAQLKTQLMQQVEQWYSKAISYRTDYYFMAACVRAGELYEDYANAIAFMDPPPEIADNPDAVDEFYNALYTQFYEPKMQQAQQVYRTAVEKAVNLGVENEWVDKAVEHLELLAPGASAELGYAEADTTAAADTTGFAPDTAATDTGDEGFGEDAVEDGAEPTEQTGEDAGASDQTGDGEEYAPTEEPAEDEGGGGCFLWPF